jgi:hypothetical protein
MERIGKEGALIFPIKKIQSIDKEKIIKAFIILCIFSMKTKKNQIL